MPTNQDVLDAGIPAPPTDGTIPLAVKQYGNAYLAITGSATSPSNYGSFLRRIGSVITVEVVADTVTVGPGAVLAVDVSMGVSSGPRAIMLTGPVFTGQVRIEPQPDGTQLLTFNAGDAVTEAVVYLLACPAEMISALDADASPEE
jgi:hypothetical protein